MLYNLLIPTLFPYLASTYVLKSPSSSLDPSNFFHLPSTVASQNELVVVILQKRGAVPDRYKCKTLNSLDIFVHGLFVLLVQRASCLVQQGQFGGIQQ